MGPNVLWPTQPKFRMAHPAAPPCLEGRLMGPTAHCVRAGGNSAAASLASRRAKKGFFVGGTWRASNPRRRRSGVRGAEGREARRRAERVEVVGWGGSVPPAD